MLKSEIILPADAEAGCLFDVVAGLPWSAWLDSGTAEHAAGRYDIIVAEPSMTVVAHSGTCRVTSADGAVLESSDDPLSVLREVLARYPRVASGELPFCGGALGYFSYDLARSFETLPAHATDDLCMPEMAAGIYEWAVVYDRQERRCWLVSGVYRDEQGERWRALQQRFACVSRRERPAEPEPMRARSAVTSSQSVESYRAAFARIQHYLADGDCYQVNFAQRFAVDVSGDPWQGYRQLRQHGAGPFSAYLNTPHGQLLSTSPERFLKLREGHVETRPIKGTRPRGADAASDRRLRDELLESEKDRAENLMIVDLLRNDLGKCCRTGSVRVPELFSVESHATVHHLVSTVTGELDAGGDAVSLLRECFPGGSITGAPKLRAMEIIEELEPQRRGVYCGSIGYIGFDGNMDCNIAIRTAIHRDGRLYYSAGGGIVKDSSCAEEYQESFDKAAAFLGCFALHGEAGSG